jgi:hypothetical protein
MPVLTKGLTFSNGEQLTAEKLNVLVDEAEFNKSTAVDNSTTRVSASGAITVKQLGITNAQLASDAVTTVKIADEAITTDKIDDGAVTSAKIGAGEVEFSNLATSVLAAIYPVGSVYINATNATNPGTLLGFGTWVAFGAGRVPVGINPSDSDFNLPEETGGVKNVKLTAAQSGLPSHRHRIWASDSSGDANQDVTEGGIMGSNDTPQRYVNTNDDGDYLVESTGGTNASQSHTNLQPYIVVYMWKRTD